MWTANLGAMAKDFLSRTVETPWNREALQAWREVAVTENVEQLYEGDYELEEFD